MENNCECENKKHWHGHGHHGGSSAIYGLGFIGAAIFFIGKGATFSVVVIGILKALVWPAYIVFNLLKFLIK